MDNSTASTAAADANAAAIDLPPAAQVLLLASV